MTNSRFFTVLNPANETFSVAIFESTL